MRGCRISEELERRRGSRPSPGTLYPVLKELKEKGLIQSDENKVYSLTEKGEKELRSALNCFRVIFYDAEDMFQCCNPNEMEEED